MLSFRRLSIAFIAYRALVTLCSANKTLPKDPTPNSFNSVKSVIFGSGSKPFKTVWGIGKKRSKTGFFMIFF